MPQPLSRVKPDAKGIHLGNVGDHVLQRRPQLALLAMEAIASWANVESFMLNLFMELFGGPRDNAATVYLALDTRSPQLKAIQAVAKKNLRKEQNELLNAILAIVRSNQKARDKLVHWIWEDTPDLPDSLLLANPKDLVETNAIPKPGKTIDVAKILSTLISAIYVYRAKDFQDIIRANERLADFGMKFRFILMNHPANTENQLYDQLCREPEIQEKLARPA